MQVFQLTLEQMLMMFLLITVGILLRKTHILPEDSHVVLAKMETYVFVPALVLHTQMTRCTVAAFTQHYGLMFYGLAIALCCMALSYPVAKLFIPHAPTPDRLYQRRVYQYAMTFSNFGFMGNFIILGIWGRDMFYLYGLFVLLYNILCNSWGLYILIPRERGVSLAANLRRGLLSPPIVATLTGMVMGLMDLSRFVPAFCLSALENASACQGPVAMLLAGVVIGGYDFKALFTDRKVYIASLVRLILIPAAAVLAIRCLGASETLQILALIAFGTPLGLNTIVFPAAYGGDPRTGASMTMVSHTLSVATIPLMYLLLIELL